MIQIHFHRIYYNRGINIPDQGEIFIEVHGHAEAGTKGNDIVCAAISALFQTLILSIARILEIKQVIDREESGYMRTNIKTSAITEENLKRLGLLIESFFLGIDEIRNEYPDRIDINIERH